MPSSLHVLRERRAPQRSRVGCEAIRPLAPPQLTSITNILPAEVLDLSSDRDPAQMLVRLDVGSQSVLARVTRLSVAQLGIAPGAQLYAQIKSVALMDP